MRRAVGLSDAAGVLVRDVADEGPAAIAGISEGDLIVKVGDAEVTDVDDLHDALEAAPVAEAFTVVVLRGSEELEFSVTLPAG